MHDTVDIFRYDIEPFILFKIYDKYEIRKSY